MGTITITRKELYGLVWSEPMIRLASRYGISDVALAKTCRKHDIPRPPRRYWAKKQFGKSPRKTPLPNPSDGSSILLRDPEECRVSSPLLRREMECKMAEEKKLETKIEVAETLRGAHPLVRQANEQFQGAEKDDSGLLIPPEETPLNIRVSKASLRRSLLIVDALLKALKQRGYEVGPGPTVEILNVQLEFSIAEQLKKTQEQPEEHDLEGHYEFGHSRFNIKRIPSGCLELHIHVNAYWITGCQTTWRDTKRQRLENRLNKFVAGLVKVAARKKEYDEEQEAQARERREVERRDREERKRRAEKRQQIEAEHQRVNSLLQQAADWQQSQDIRCYIEANKQRYLASHGQIEEGGEFAKWLVWANEQADRLDPLKDSPPSILDEPVPEEPKSTYRWQSESCR